MKRATLQGWQPGSEEDPGMGWKNGRNTLETMNEFTSLDPLMAARDLAKRHHLTMAQRMASGFVTLPSAVMGHQEVRLLFSTGVPWWVGANKDPRHKIWPFVLGAYWEQAYISQVRSETLYVSIVKWRKMVRAEMGNHLAGSTKIFAFPDGLSEPTNGKPNPGWMKSAETVADMNNAASVALGHQQKAKTQYASIQKVVKSIETSPWVREGSSVDKGLSFAVDRLAEVSIHLIVRNYYSMLLT